jgi:mRNA interferase MazF
MAVTSQTKSPDVFGEVTIIQWKKAGLLKPSVVKPVFATIEKGLVLKKLGRLVEEERRTLRQALQTILGE